MKQPRELAAAVAGGSRIDLLDALRGFALFGIFLANILYWSGFGLENDARRLALWGNDAVTAQYRFHHFLIDGKFYSLFSMMFGAGFALQLDRLTARGADGVRIFRRRARWLLVIGLIHAQFLWDGDILTLYALLGLTLPWLHKWSERTLVMAAMLLIFVIPIAGALIANAIGINPGAPLYALAATMDSWSGVDFDNISSSEFLGQGSWREFAIWCFSGPEYTWASKLENWRIPKVLGLMLLGMAAGRRLHDGSILENRKLLWQLLVGGLAISIPASYFYAGNPGLNQTSLPSLIGTVPGAIAYAAGFALLWPHGRRAMGLLAPVGRMALTNYLSHSVIGAVLFYGIGFGLMGQLSVPAFYAVAVAILVTQLALSHWWLAHHAQGPMEALWRRLTYGRVPAAA